MIRRILHEHLGIFAALARWSLLVLPLGAAVGSACALFLALLDDATTARLGHGWLLYLLPVAGALVTLMYRRFGHGAAGGNNLVMDEIHEPGAGGVPARLAPLVLVGSVATHLCGGSAGREGTAVQMGGSIAGLYCRAMPARFHGGTAAGVRALLMSGVAAGFGGVFGTPLAGAVFALEVPAIGRMSYAAAVPCLVAAIVADRSCAWWGIHHTRYPQLAGFGPAATGVATAVDLALLAKVAVAGALFGLLSRLFSELVHAIGDAFREAIARPAWRPVVGGLLVIALVELAGTRDYLGLGVSSTDPSVVTIVSAFREGGAHPWSWLWKVVFTTVTLGASFKGGEVTPLFFIGATFGNTLAPLLGIPVELAAALGFAAVFAGATNTPLACTVMAVELFGPAGMLYFAVACFLAYACSGHSGIYLSQRIATPKLEHAGIPAAASLRAAHDARRPRAAAGATLPRRTDDVTGGMTMVKTKRAHRISGREMGQLRIYLARRVRGRERSGWKRVLGRRPLYMEVIAAAREAGILHAAAHHSHHGYSGDQAIQSDDMETPNPNLTMVVELIDERARLEAFCRAHGDLLKDRVMVYKHVEHWDLHDDVLEEADAAPAGLEARTGDD